MSPVLPLLMNRAAPKTPIAHTESVGGAPFFPFPLLFPFVPNMLPFIGLERTVLFPLPFARSVSAGVKRGLLTC